MKSAQSRLAPQEFSARHTLVDVLRRHAATAPNKTALVYLTDGEESEVSLTYAQLDERARMIAAKLQEIGATEERALFFFPPGLEFVEAFFGCLYAGVIAVPAYPPRPGRSLRRISAIVEQCEASYILTSSHTLQTLEQQISREPALKSITCLTTDTLPKSLATNWRPKDLSDDTLAFLQYTSGSTAAPKGVMVSHGNLISNTEMIRVAFEHDENSTVVGWLPLFHDMGLVGNLLQQIYIGANVVLFSPTSFLERPVRWLKAISKYRARSSGGPNFAYELCTRAITREERKGLDLSSWTVAYNGSESVRPETLRRFAETFAECGFNANAFLPCYGLAEATLIVSGQKRHAPPLTLSVDIQKLEKGKVEIVENAPGGTRGLTSCGVPCKGVLVEIANPETREKCRENEIGEIWVSGPNVAKGYWNRPDETRAAFGGVLAGDPACAFLRTGDLGFMRDGELFITGRMKDMIIIRGRNIYPEDVERSLEPVSTLVRPNRCAVFSMETEGIERLALVVEADRAMLKAVSDAKSSGSPVPPSLINLISDFQRTVVSEFEVPLTTIVFIKPTTMPRTSSGKIQRSLCRKLLIEGKLETVYSSDERSDRDARVEVHASPEPASVSTGSDNAAHELTPRCREMVHWVRDYAERRLNSRLADERRSIAPHVVLDFGNRGLMGLQIPEKWGGVNFNTTETMRVIEQLSAVDVSVALMVGIHNSLGMRPLMNFGRPEQKDRLLPHLASGRRLAALALTEPAAGSHAIAIEGRAVQSDGRWRVNCQKSWIGLGNWAGVTTFFVKAQAATGQPLGSVAFVVEDGTRGLRYGGEALTMGLRSIVQSTLYLEDAMLEDSQLLDEPGNGFRVAYDTLNYARLGLGAMCVGTMKRCAQLMLRYSSRRKISTGTLLDNPVTLNRLWDITSAAGACDALIFGIARALDAGLTVPDEAYMVCKTSAPELAFTAADHLMQNLGGRGYIESSLVPQILRDIRPIRIFEGPTETLLMHLGGNLLRGTGAFRGLIQGIFDQADLAGELDIACELVRASLSKLGTEDTTTHAHWANFHVGSLGTAIALAAASRKQHSIRKSEETAASVEWSLQQVRAARERLAVILAEQPRRGLKRALCATLARYRDDIGDIELSLAGEDHLPDPLLRRDQAEPILAPAPRQVPAPSQASRPLSEPIELAPPASPSPSKRDTAGVIHGIVLDWLRKEMHFKEKAVAFDATFPSLGIDSLGMALIASDIEKALKIELKPELIYECQTINALARHLDASR